MPALALLLQGLFASLVATLASLVTKKTAIGLSAAAAFIALTLAFLGIMVGVMNVILSVASPPYWFMVGFTFVKPPNFEACFAAYISAHVSAALYRTNVQQLKIFASA